MQNSVDPDEAAQYEPPHITLVNTAIINMQETICVFTLSSKILTVNLLVSRATVTSGLLAHT